MVGMDRSGRLCRQELHASWPRRKTHSALQTAQAQQSAPAAFLECMQSLADMKPFIVILRRSASVIASSSSQHPMAFLCGTPQRFAQQVVPIIPPLVAHQTALSPLSLESSPHPSCASEPAGRQLDIFRAPPANTLSVASEPHAKGLDLVPLPSTQAALLAPRQMRAHCLWLAQVAMG